jgi:Iron/manganese superoxide dismutases, C-terminal domain
LLGCIVIVKALPPDLPLYAGAVFLGDEDSKFLLPPRCSCHRCQARNHCRRTLGTASSSVPFNDAVAVAIRAGLHVCLPGRVQRRRRARVWLGWVFVTVARDGKLAIETKPNQDTPLMEGKRVLLGNDVWEHAYYLNYQNRRADYLKA